MIITRDFNFNDEKDYEFAYSILQNRYSAPETIITNITPNCLPTYEEHKRNIKTFFNILRIGIIGDISIGMGYIDKKNYVGFFYERSNLKAALKKYNIKGIDLSKFFLNTILSLAPKQTTLFARVSSKNSLANKTALRLMTLISRTSTYNTYSYSNE
jgi:hypothetical protein